MLIHITENNEYAKTFSSGATLVTGKFKGELTNLASGKTVPINISGPVSSRLTGTLRFSEDAR